MELFDVNLDRTVLECFWMVFGNREEGEFVVVIAERRRNFLRGCRRTEPARDMQRRSISLGKIPSHPLQRKKGRDTGE